MKTCLFAIAALLILHTGCGTLVTEVQDSYVRCRSIAGDRTAIKVPEWEFNAISDLLNSIVRPGEALTTAEIRKRAAAGMSRELRDSLQSPDTSVETTFRELEVRGVFSRSEDGRSQPVNRYRRVL